ncbi:hypothetical protein [Streptomyces fuscichromogenes]|uniref:DNA-binding protein n=1 Tax=Streptomyces fuscichromogenes TaxID=1324013 RepID=A0A918CSY6_9ACTN|nr:hypothetical protein [Streptomyces fuscichromogenes]GGN19070.1 hypothetical protein GCM10011578_048730 [Streptomyces fuscichromogenes]
MTTYDDTTAALLDAGAILPSGTTAREDADVLTARTYTHAALDGRTVVRLVPGTLGEAEDLALEFLGLAREPEAPEVGQVRRETLGFPAWALVHDPANGHHALALVKDVERLARQAKSKPGNAKEGFEALGERLGRAVPHFLPTFYEQAARVFLQHENTTYAGAFFGKAREAERVHALAVDEERQRAVFLEFAFAGALTVKALKEYVKDLARRLEPVTAWAQFRQLTVERCAAGMPPYASLPQDARGLIRAAGLDRVTEECALVADLLASPAAVRAPASFWNAYRSLLPVLAERRPQTRARLLEIMPAGLGREVADDEFWLALLAECGSDLLLTEDGGEADAADWLGRWAQHRKHGAAYSRRSPATLALAERMAPRLRAAGRPVDLFTGRWQPGADLDLLDLCVAEGIALAVPDADTQVHLPLAVWLRDEQPGERDLKALAAEPRYRALLSEAVEGLGRGQGPAELPKVAAHPVLGDVLREWLQEATAEFAACAGLPGVDTKLERLRPFRAVVQESPQAVRGLTEYDIVPVLGRTLRAGILDELGWSALEEALALLDGEVRKDRDNSLSVTEAWPALVLARGHKAVVVGPEGILLSHDLRLPTDLDRWQRPRFRYVDGELLVTWRDGSKQHGYWSNRPSEVVTLGGEQFPGWWSGMDAANASIPLPGGGRATGGRTLHAGDTVLPPSRPVIGDGTTYWRQGRQGRQSLWLEYDPATGEHGRASLPALLASAVREDASLLHGSCEVLPLQPGLEHSPFGTDGTVLGRWVRTEGQGAEARTTAGTPDGRTATLRAAPGGRVPGVPLGALRLPGGAAPIAAQTYQSVALHADDGTELGRVSFGESGGAYAAGTRLVPPVAFWHALRPRDERGSAVLRALTDASAGELMRAAATALGERQQALAEAGKDDRARAAVPTADAITVTAVARALPDLTDRRLLTGVAALVRAALRFAEVAATLARPVQERPRPRQRTEGMFADYSPLHGGDRTLDEATRGVVTLQNAWHGGWAALRQIRAVNHVLSGRPADGKPLPEREGLAVGDGWLSEEHTVPGIGAEWTPVLGALRPLAYRAASPALTEVQREPLLLLFEALTEGPLLGLGGTLRTVVLSEPHDKQQRVGQVLRRDGRTVVVLGCQSVDARRDSVEWLALDHDPTGAFGAVGHFTLVRETRYTAGIPADRLAGLTRLIREKGAAPWRPEAPATLAAATNGALGPLQATVLLAGHPHSPTAEGLAVVGLKPRQRTFGAQLLDALGRDEQRVLLGALLPDDPAELWTTGPDTAAAGRLWAERLGSLVRLPEELSTDLAGMGVGHAEAVLNPARTPWLARTTAFRPDKDGDFAPVDPSAVPSSYTLSGAVGSLAALAYVLPYGHPLRAGLADGLGALRRRLADPELLLDLNLDWTEKNDPTCVRLRKVFGLPETGGADAHGLTRAGDALVLRPWYADMEHVLLRPGALSGADDPVFGLLEGLVGEGRARWLRDVRALFGDDLARALAAEGPAGYAQDPAVSVPALVAEVAEAHGLGQDAAALYLQLLALPDPTDRNCARWTGWKPARTKKARAELAATALVVEAKRPRAGRTLFLPGGWRDFRAPALPLETWKEALYPVSDGNRTLPLVPVPELFARAWERVRAGDAPAYEQLTTRATRGGRRR